MTIYNQPDATVFASGAKDGEVKAFPDIARGFGIDFDQNNGFPTFEQFNGLMKSVFEGIKYLEQYGVPLWRNDLEYPIGAKVLYSGDWYQATAQNIGKIPSQSQDSWLISVADNLTSRQKGQALSANQGRILSENKLDKTTYSSTQQRGIVQLVDSLINGGTDKALTAEAMKNLYSMFSTNTNNIKIPRADDQSNPWIIQFGYLSAIATGEKGTKPFNFPFPNRAVAVFGSFSSFGNPSNNPIHLDINDKNGLKYWVKKVDSQLSNDYYWFAIGY